MVPMESKSLEIEMENIGGRWILVEFWNCRERFFEAERWTRRATFLAESGSVRWP